MMKKSYLSYMIWFAGILIFGLSSSACKKEDPTIVIVNIIDSIGKRVDSAKVIVYGSGTEEEENPDKGELRFSRYDTMLTGASGSITMDLSDYTKPGQAGFVVLDIEAYKNDEKGVGIINVEENKTNQTTVRIQ